MKILGKHFQELLPKYEQLYAGNYGPDCKYYGKLGKKVSKLCQKYGIADRMPRYVPEGPLDINKRISEKLHNKTYRMELDCVSHYNLWAYRKAAWSLENLPEYR